MRTRLAILVLFAGCSRSTRYVSLPRPDVAIPTDSFYSKVGSWGWNRSSRSNPLDLIEARCADPAICAAVAQPHTANGVRFAELQVLGKRPGSTTVEVVLRNPFTETIERHAVPINVVAPPPRAVLAVGAPLPAGGELLHQTNRSEGAQDETLHAGRCSSDTDLASKRPDVHVFACSTAIEVHGERRYRVCDANRCGNPGESYVLCAQVRDGVVTGTAALGHAMDGSRTTTIEGRLEAGVCVD